jgi:hypothetical protein
VFWTGALATGGHHGSGNIGLAVADYLGFRQERFQVIALFDKLREKVWRVSRSGVSIYDILKLKEMTCRVGARRCQDGHCRWDHKHVESLARSGPRSGSHQSQEC